jgi:hypothetical protein
MDHRSPGDPDGVAEPGDPGGNDKCLPIADAAIGRMGASTSVTILASQPGGRGDTGRDAFNTATAAIDGSHAQAGVASLQGGTACCASPTSIP